MKTVMVIFGMMAAATAAHADGFNCVGEQTGTTLKVYNSTSQTVGTRVPAVMIVSDPYVNYPNKTIAKFTSAEGNLEYAGYGTYVANVDLRFKNSNRAGENVGGTKLGQLDTIELSIDGFSYYTADEAKDAEHMSARIRYNKRNGEVLSEKATCARYTKN